MYPCSLAAAAAAEGKLSFTCGERKPANQRCQGRKEGSYEARIGIHKMKVAGWLADIAPGGLYHIRIKHSKCLLGSKENTNQY